MRRRGFTLPQVVAVIAAFLVLAVIFFPLATSNPPQGGRSACQSNLKQIALGIKAYVQDYDEKFPLSGGNGIVGDAGYGWAGATQMYLKSPQVLQCPDESTSGYGGRTTAAPEFCDYFYNASLSNVSEASLNYISNTFLNGDFHSGHAANSASNTTNWSKRAPYAQRHLSGSNFAFTDGHVKWLKPGVPTTAPPTSAIFTFSPFDAPPRYKRPSTNRFQTH